MKARPILFSGEMVRALLDGRKTQTRRIIKPQPSNSAHAGDCEKLDDYAREWFQWFNGCERGTSFLCPYGDAGDLLYVRETYRVIDGQDRPEIAVDYKASTPDEYRLGDVVGGSTKWKSGRFMPRRLSRLTLRIVDIRVQCLQDIGEKDAIAEGPPCPEGWPNYPGAIIAFHMLWNSINGVDAWDKNPWVWAITFEVIKQNVDDVLNGGGHV